MTLDERLRQEAADTARSIGTSALVQLRMRAIAAARGDTMAEIEAHANRLIQFALTGTMPRE